MQLKDFLDNLQNSPNTIEFQDTMAVIDAAYIYTPVVFKNGDLVNQAGENEGSCKLFAFAKLNNLDKEKTLACFGAYYRDDVLQNPEGDNHQNIRNFMKTGWGGITFENDVLVAR
ncbi:MAG: HopJ type III effector protein [Gammaproteobacteria bacterium]